MADIKTGSAYARAADRSGERASAADTGDEGTSCTPVDLASLALGESCAGLLCEVMLIMWNIGTQLGQKTLRWV
jgi:hypothetical protein